MKRFWHSGGNKEFDASVQKIDYLAATPPIALGFVFVFGVVWVGLNLLFIVAGVFNRLVTDQPLSMPSDLYVSPLVIATLIITSLWVGVGLENEARQKAEERRKTWYESYLNSYGWEAARSLALIRAEGRCQVCNSPYNLHAHHRTYSRLGIEREEDLTVLCRECHSLFHADGRMPDQQD